MQIIHRESKVIRVRIAFCIILVALVECALCRTTSEPEVGIGITERNPDPDQEDYLDTYNFFDIFSSGSEWARMQLGIEPETYTYDTETEMEEEPNPDIKLSVTELIKKYGFPVESHNVYTEDDYVLTLHRIPYGRRGRGNGLETEGVEVNELNETLSQGSKKPIALLHHGLCSSSVDWIMNTPDKALPYMLADAGYDVWLANARGNRYSRRHISMTPKKSKYWDFSWHEIGEYDVPAVIDYILTLTGQKELNYIGHSMGTTVFFVAMSLKPEYNIKIRKMVALAPSVHLEDMKSPAKYLAAFSTIEKFIYDLFGHGEILPDFLLPYIHKIAPSVCTKRSKTTVSNKICDNIMYALGGWNPEQLNETQLPVILSHTPSSCSTKAGVHYLQTVSSEKFRQYDYGIVGNIRKYSQMSPPQYNLKKVTAPVSIFWSENDVLCDPKGIKRLADELPNLVNYKKVNDSKFTHIDFIFAKDADKLLYRDVLHILNQP